MVCYPPAFMCILPPGLQEQIAHGSKSPIRHTVIPGRKSPGKSNAIGNEVTNACLLAIQLPSLDVVKYDIKKT